MDNLHTLATTTSSGFDDYRETNILGNRLSLFSCCDVILGPWQDGDTGFYDGLTAGNLVTHDTDIFRRRADKV